MALCLSHYDLPMASRPIGPVSGTLSVCAWTAMASSRKTAPVSGALYAVAAWTAVALCVERYGFPTASRPTGPGPSTLYVVAACAAMALCSNRYPWLPTPLAVMSGSLSAVAAWTAMAFCLHHYGFLMASRHTGPVCRTFSSGCLNL